MRIKALLIFLVFVLVFPLFAQDNKIVISVTGKNIDNNALARMIRDYLVQTNIFDEYAVLSVGGLPDAMKVNSFADISVTQEYQDGALGKKINARVENYDIPDTEPVFLMFSNHPEKVASYGVLFNASCVFKKKVRLQFYHLSAMKDKNPYFSLRFYNPDNTKTAKIHISGDMQGPSENFMKVGHQNNIGFLNKKNNKTGIVYEIKPGGALTLFNEEMPDGKLFCGIYEMYLIEGPPVWFYMFSNKTKDEKPVYPEVSSTDTHAKGVYTVTDFNYDVKFETGEKEKYITFGDTPLRNIFPEKKLAGDYGAIYNINLSAQETTGKSGRLEIIFQPRGGGATGTFIVDGRLIEIGSTKAKIEKKIWSYNLRSYERRVIKIKTMPEGASNYPVRIIFRFVKC